MKETHRVLRPGGFFVYVDPVLPTLLTAIGRSIFHVWDGRRLSDIESNLDNGRFSKVHASLSRMLIVNRYESVWKKR